MSERASTRSQGADVRQQMAIALLSRGKSYKSAAKELNIDERTLSKWVREDKDFAERLEIAKAEYCNTALLSIDESMNSLELKAVSTLREMLSDDKPDNIKLKAIQLILNHQNSRKTSGEGQVAVVFNMPEPGMPAEESVENGDTTGSE